MPISTARSANRRATLGLVRNSGSSLPPAKWSGDVRLDLQRVVKTLVGLQAPHGDYPIVYLADTAQILLADVGGRLAVLVGKVERPPQKISRINRWT